MAFKFRIQKFQQPLTKHPALRNCLPFIEGQRKIRIISARESTAVCSIAEIVAPEIDFPTIAEVGGRLLFCVAVANEIMSNGSHDRSHNRVSVFGGLPELNGIPDSGRMSHSVFFLLRFRI